MSLERIHWTPGAKNLFYQSKQDTHDDSLFAHPKGETLDIFELIARVLTQRPEPRTHGVRYFGVYSSRARALRKKRDVALQSLDGDDNSTLDGASIGGAPRTPILRRTARCPRRT